MLTYLIRRLLLFIPTLIGATVVVFAVVALAPGGMRASAVDAEGSMKPEQRRARERYLNARFGLDKPYFVQYGRWLNNVSPIGFAIRREEDPDVAAAALEEQRLQNAKRDELRNSGKAAREID